MGENQFLGLLCLRDQKEEVVEILVEQFLVLLVFKVLVCEFEELELVRVLVGRLGAEVLFGHVVSHYFKRNIFEEPA